MPLDPSIPLQVQTPTFDLPGIFGKAQAFKSAQTQNQLQQAQLANAPIQNQLLQQQLATSQSDQQLKQLQLASTHVDMINNLLTDVNPSNYDAKVQYAQSMGILKPGEAPPTYDPTWVQSRVDNTKAVKAKLDQALEQAQIGQAQATTAKTNSETAQNNYLNQSLFGAGGGGTGGAGHLDASGQPLSGDAYLATLPPQRAAQIKAYALGAQLPPTGRGTTPQLSQLTEQQILQYDPAADSITRRARQATYQDMTSGKSSQEIKNLDTLSGHIDALATAGASLNNGPLDSYNFIANQVGQHLQNKAVLNPYELQKGVSADEIVQLLTGGKGTLEDRRKIENTLSSSASDEDRSATIKQAVGVIYDRAKALQDKYAQGMGTTASNGGTAAKPIIAPSTLALFKKYGFDTNYFGGISPSSNASESASTGSAIPGIQQMQNSGPLPQSPQLPATLSMGAQGNSAIQQKVSLAKQMGYSDAEIQQYLQGAR